MRKSSSPSTKSTKRATDHKGKNTAQAKSPAKLLVAMTGKASPAKAKEGDEPVFVYIASLQQPQCGVAERIDALAAETLPNLQRAVKWGMAWECASCFVEFQKPTAHGCESLAAEWEGRSPLDEVAELVRLVHECRSLAREVLGPRHIRHRRMAHDATAFLHREDRADIDRTPELLRERLDDRRRLWLPAKRADHVTVKPAASSLIG